MRGLISHGGQGLVASWRWWDGRCYAQRVSREPSQRVFLPSSESMFRLDRLKKAAESSPQRGVRSELFSSLDNPLLLKTKLSATSIYVLRTADHSHDSTL